MAAKRTGRRILETTVIPLFAGIAITAVGIAWLVADAGVTFDPRATIAEPAGTGALAVAADGPLSSPEIVGAPDRNITPEGVTSVPRHEGPYVRVPSDPKPVEATTRPVRETLYRRVVVLDAGSFRAIEGGRARVIRVDGIMAPQFAERCTDPDGHEWKCGARARAELARLIGGRAVACAGLPDHADNPIGRCRAGVYDLGRWLVENGWADAVDPALKPFEEDARRNRKGRFGPAPFGVIAG